MGPFSVGCVQSPPEVVPIGTVSKTVTRAGRLVLRALGGGGPLSPATSRGSSETPRGACWEAGGARRVVLVFLPFCEGVRAWEPGPR